MRKKFSKGTFLKNILGILFIFTLNTYLADVQAARHMFPWELNLMLALLALRSLV